MLEITRARLIQAVEAGIDSASQILTDAEKMALRHVARTETKVVVGQFTDTDEDGNRCGCPLDLAGVEWENDQRPLDVFYRRFDTTAALRHYGVMKVVG